MFFLHDFNSTVIVKNEILKLKNISIDLETREVFYEFTPNDKEHADLLVLKKNHYLPTEIYNKMLEKFPCCELNTNRMKYITTEDELKELLK